MINLVANNNSIELTEKEKSKTETIKDIIKGEDGRGITTIENLPNNDWVFKFTDGTEEVISNEAYKSLQAELDKKVNKEDLPEPQPPIDTSKYINNYFIYSDEEADNLLNEIMSNPDNLPARMTIMYENSIMELPRFSSFIIVNIDGTPSPIPYPYYSLEDKPYKPNVIKGNGIEAEGGSYYNPEKVVRFENTFENKRLYEYRQNRFWGTIRLEETETIDKEYKIKIDNNGECTFKLPQELIGKIAFINYEIINNKNTSMTIKIKVINNKKILAEYEENSAWTGGGYSLSTIDIYGLDTTKANQYHINCEVY